jgi:hypothetical protein
MRRTSVLWQLVPTYCDYLLGCHGTSVCLRTLYRSTIRKTAKFFAKSRSMKYLNALLIMYTTSQSYLTIIKVILQKKQQKDSSSIVLVVRRHPHSVQVRGDVRYGPQPCRPPPGLLLAQRLPLPGGVRPGRESVGWRGRGSGSW